VFRSGVLVARFAPFSDQVYHLKLQNMLNNSDNIDYCGQYNCPHFELDEGCTHPGQPATDDCDIRKMLPKVEPVSLDPPMYVKFSYRDEWIHIPANEIYPAWSGNDIALAATAFRKMHGSDGCLVVFSTTDLIDWKMVGEIP